MLTASKSKNLLYRLINILNIDSILFISITEAKNYLINMLNIDSIQIPKSFTKVKME